MAQFFFRALPVITAKDATMDFEQLTFALNNGDIEVNSKGELKLKASWGYISSTAEIKGGSKDFTAKKEGEGQYKIAWTTEKPTAFYAISLAAVFAASRGLIIQSTKVTAKEFEVATSKLEVATNSDFSFVVMNT